MMNGALMSRIGRVLLPLGWAAVLAAPFVTHAALATGRFAGAAALLAIGEVALLATLALRKATGWARAGGVLAAVCVITALAVRLLRPDRAGTAGLVAAAGLSHAIIYGSLLLLFSRSLAPGAVDLITGLATRLRGSLTPAMLAYTRGVTKAWCVFFAGQLTVSALLLLFAPLAAWSLFVNVLDGPSVLVMFACEYAVRRWRFRGYRHISPVETFRSFARDRARP